MRVLLITSFVVMILQMYAQQRLKQAPVNPDFTKFMEEAAFKEQANVAPSPYVLDFKQYHLLKKYTPGKSFPIVYDMRTAGPGGTSLLTPVKHQLSCGACWAFATYSSIESVWKVLGLGEYDLSENNIKNCHGFDLDPCQWGHHFMSTAYLVRGDGPVEESEDPYQPENDSCVGGITPVAYIPYARYLPEDHDAFKETIMNQGAVYNTYRSITSNYEWINGHYTYCYQGGASTTHAMAIVGWNDTITTACGTGAWICKNEYGEGFGEDGFFYTAYQDTLVLKYNAIWPEREDFDPDQYILQYDTIGGWPFVGYEDTIAYGLIKYTPESDLFLTRVGTYTVSFGTYLTVRIYDDFDGNTLSNLLAEAPEFFCDYPGYWTVDLPSHLMVASGNDFFIEIRYNSPGCDYPIAVEAIEEGYTAPHIETGKCWASEDESVWEACGTGTPNEFDLCIKAYGFEPVRMDLKVFLEGPFNGTDMNNFLQGLPEFPLQQPYNVAPWDYFGNESLASVPPDVVDWILVELRETAGDVSSASEATVISRQAVLLKSDGSITGTNGTFPEFLLTIKENLFVVIYHRNHLPIISASAVQKSNGKFTYDFSEDMTKVYGGLLGHKNLGNGVWGMISGDGNPSGIIDDYDKAGIWQQQVGVKGYESGDFNLNSEVNNPDKNEFWFPNKGAASQVPE